LTEQFEPELIAPFAATPGLKCHKCGNLYEKHYIAVIDHGNGHKLKVYDYMS